MWKISNLFFNFFRSVSNTRPYECQSGCTIFNLQCHSHKLYLITVWTLPVIGCASLWWPLVQMNMNDPITPHFQYVTCSCSVSCCLYYAAFISCSLSDWIAYDTSDKGMLLIYTFPAVNNAFFVTECFNNIVTMGNFNCKLVSRLQRQKWYMAGRSHMIFFFFLIFCFCFSILRCEERF